VEKTQRMQTLQATAAYSVSVAACATCGYELEQGAKFCGFCGALTPAQGAAPAPTFAQIAPMQTPTVSKELQGEAAKLLMQLARERLMLIFHWSMFIGLNLVGLVLAMKCYHEFIGDEMSKIMVASTPFLFINSIALLFIVLIRGTRKEIGRLKERISYVKFKIDFGHLM
jgi:hypothetical protein